MIQPRNVMIFPSGTEIAFEIFNALKYSKFVNIFGGTSAQDHSEFVYERLIQDLPYISDKDFLNVFNEVLIKNKIEYVYPAHDAACIYLSRHRSEIKAEIICAEFDTVNICRSKEKTYQFFINEHFIPKVYAIGDPITDYPVFIKPKIGEGAKGAKLISNENELKFFVDENPEVVICEYLSGEEYTIDCFTDRYHNLRVIKLRDRSRIRTGISVRSSALSVDNSIADIANRINQKLNFRGAWFFQVKKNDKGEYKLMEISPRIPGTMGLSRNAGINFPLLTLFDFWEMDVNIIDNHYKIMLDRAFYSAYKIDMSYQHIYVDFDDTLILKGKVNTELISFLYQALNQNKKIYLLSKHRNNIFQSLKKYKIATEIFTEIILLNDHEEKKDYIKFQDAIFIDDSFAERYKVSESLKIPVFDVDMIESLVDWRR